ncbi:MAG: glutamate--tRNA ligase [Crenarchaeota archaeon]|nr:glutamate--tRNA ligase [Thermoproteota archaeon]
MNDEEIKNEIRKFALQNAAEHEGQTRDKTILVKIMGNVPELRQKAKEISPIITEIVSEINQIPLEKQQKEIQEKYPELLEIKKEKPQKESLLPALKNIEGKEIITRFPPAPNGYPHIGHAKAAIISEEYAKMYGGKTILRFEDTNPGTERLEYYAAIKVGMDWLGIKYDSVEYVSDNLDVLYKKADQIIKSNDAYVCTCSKDSISKDRREMTECDCTKQSIEENEKLWHKMFDEKGFKEGQALLRFRGNMQSGNTTMRDPALFRINTKRHARQEQKYKVWPTYDFAGIIFDSISKVSHAMRSKEFELRKELHHTILDKLGMEKSEFIFFGRLDLEGMPVSKSALKPLIENGKVPWYDDPRLPTLEGLRRRGIRPEAIKKFVLSLGLTKNDTVSPFASLEAFNKKIIDGESVRLHMVRNPKKLKITNLPSTKFRLSNHPTIDLGKRTVEVNDSVLIEGEDAKELKKDEFIRLLGIGIFKIIENGLDLVAEFIAENAKNIEKNIQWVAGEPIKIKIMVPNQLFFGEKFNEDSLKEIEGYVEQAYLELKDGDEIQFIRFGYCRKESTHQVIFTHK